VEYYYDAKPNIEGGRAMSAQNSEKSKFDIELPQSIIDSFARHLVSEIRAYYDSEEGQAAFEEWLKQRNDTEDA
jgi:hypothetical protein